MVFSIWAVFFCLLTVGGDGNNLHGLVRNRFLSIGARFNFISDKFLGFWVMFGLRIVQSNGVILGLWGMLVRFGLHMHGDWVMVIFGIWLVTGLREILDFFLLIVFWFWPIVGL